MFLHGGDYNPEQWIEDKELVIEDIKRIKAANINVVTIGMFNWSTLEPEEGVFNFEWLRFVLKELEKNELQVILATPTAGRPHWLSQKYRETSRINRDGLRELSGIRQNHCLSSPKFREKAEIIINKLIDLSHQFDNIHSWHINNEFGGECYCEHCQQKFRDHLQRKYKTIKNLNDSWWNTFWSHNYNSFAEIQAPSTNGDLSNTPLKVNWSRFMTDNHLDYYLFEKKLLNERSQLQVSTNFHGEQIGGWMDYYRFAKHVDYISFDIYPQWDTKDNYQIATEAMTNLLIQSSLDKNKDFYIMESSPGSTNWQDYTILKSAKLHYASTFLEALAGSKSFIYFQLKQSRGSSEKFHGAVLDINSNTESRVYKYVRDFGEQISQIDRFSAAKLKKEVAIYYSWDSTFLLDHSEGPCNKGLYVKEIINQIVEYFINIGKNVQFVYDETELEKYETVIFPYSYTVSDAVLDKIKMCENKHVIAFPLMNYADSDDLFHMGTLPHNIDEHFGVKVKELNVLIDGQTVNSKNYDYTLITEVVECTSAEQLEKFDHEILETAIARNIVGNTEFYYLSGILTLKSLHKFFDNLFNAKYDGENKIVQSKMELDGVTYQYIINFSDKEISLPKDKVVWCSADLDDVLNKYDFSIIKLR